MLIRAIRNFSSGRVVCLLANSQKADRIGAELMRNLKTISGSDLKFIGSGGPLMEAEGILSYYSTNEFHPKPFVPFRGTIAEEINLWLWVKNNPITKTYTRPMHKILKEFKSKDLVNQIMSHSPSVIMTLDHDILSLKQHRQFNEEYSKLSVPKPKQVHFGRFIYRLNPEQLKNAIDHVFYTIPINPRNWSDFQFPSTYVGQSPFEKAYRFLLERNGGDHLVSKDSVQMNIDHFYSETESYIESERKTFRRAHGISDTATVLYLSPGNKMEEINWSVPILNKTANEFISQHADSHNSVPASHVDNEYVVVIPSDSSNQDLISSKVKGLNWKSRVIVLDNEEQRRSAQAGSDYSIAYNGDVVFENLVNQLPTIIIENMGKIEFYFVLAWNRFNNDLNIIADGDVFPEIIEGQAHSAKLVDLLNTWHNSPAERFWPLQGYENILHKLLPVKTREMGMGTHHEYYSPDRLTAQTLWEFIQTTPERKFAEEENSFLRHLNS